jgi:Arc/MetJ family transcription regulator
VAGIWIQELDAIMSTTQIDLDQGLLAKAAKVLGTRTKKDTVNQALRRVVQEDIRRRHVDELADGALPDLADPEIMSSAWR